MKDDSDVPEGWGADPLSEFIETARHNTFATFANLRPTYNHLATIHGVFQSVIENSNRTAERFALFFLLRADAAFLGALRLALSGQIAEVYAVLRTSIEASLYGLHCIRHPDAQDIWLRRNEGDEERRRCKIEFTVSNVMATLCRESPDTHRRIKLLYERTIDYGGHPNEQSIFSNIRRTDTDEHIGFDLIYLTGDTPAFRVCLKTCGQVGVCSLDVFRLIYTERFDLLGLTARLDRLKKRL